MMTKRGIATIAVMAGVMATAGVVAAGSVAVAESATVLARWHVVGDPFPDTYEGLHNCLEFADSYPTSYKASCKLDGETGDRYWLWIWS